jgi:hypothetical protein
MRLLTAVLVLLPALLQAALPPQDGHGVTAAPGEGIFVAVGYGGFRGWSRDGATWAAERWSSKNEDDDNIIFTLAYRAGVFVAAGGGASKGFVLLTVDGKRWNEVVVERNRICQVTTIDDRFIATGADTFLLSSDGVTWTMGGASRPVSAAAPGWGNYRRHAVGADGLVVYAGDYSLDSADGKRVGWTGFTKRGETALVVSTWPGDIRGLAYGNQRFVACGESGQVLMSTDGATWKEVLQTRDQHHDEAVRYGNGSFWLYGQAGVRKSPDGVVWEAVTDPPRLARATSRDGIAIDCGWGGIDVAADGGSWTKATVPIDATGICAVAWGIPRAALRTDTGAQKTSGVPAPPRARAADAAPR